MTRINNVGPIGASERELTKEAETALDEIYEDQGELSEEYVVKAARLKSSPLHQYFEWDDKKAGHMLRLVQARAIITSVTVSILDSKGNKSKHRVYESTYDPESEEPTTAWQRREDIEADRGPEFFVRTMRREWKGFYNRWSDNKAFWKMIDKTRNTGTVE